MSEKSILEDYVETLAKSISEKENDEIQTKIITALSEDDHFIKWFKKNYDFMIIRKSPQTRMDDNILTVTHTFGYYGPKRVFLRERIKRKIMSLFNKPYSISVPLKKTCAYQKVK